MFGISGHNSTAGALLDIVLCSKANLFHLLSAIVIAFFVLNTQSLLRVMTPLKMILVIVLFAFALIVMFAHGFNTFRYF